MYIKLQNQSDMAHKSQHRTSQYTCRFVVGYLYFVIFTPDVCFYCSILALGSDYTGDRKIINTLFFKLYIHLFVKFTTGSHRRYGWSRYALSNILRMSIVLLKSYEYHSVHIPAINLIYLSTWV